MHECGGRLGCLEAAAGSVGLAAYAEVFVAGVVVSVEALGAVGPVAFDVIVVLVAVDEIAEVVTTVEVVKQSRVLYLIEWRESVGLRCGQFDCGRTRLGSAY